MEPYLAQPGNVQLSNIVSGSIQKTTVEVLTATGKGCQAFAVCYLVQFICVPGIIECWWALKEFDNTLPCSCEGGREVRTVLLSSVRMTSGIGPRHSLETEDEPRWSKVH